jgi:hypothetical protein
MSAVRPWHARIYQYHDCNNRHEYDQPLHTVELWVSSLSTPAAMHRRMSSTSPSLAASVNSSTRSATIILLYALCMYLIDVSVSQTNAYN